MKKYTVGIDSGSTMCKGIVFDGEKIVDSMVTETGWNSKESALLCLQTLLDRNEIEEAAIEVISTGYGRETIDFADRTLTEISCHALGGVYLEPQVEAVIDIGGQDSKIIKIQKGKAVSFHMNDKCAAGTGRFLEMACLRLGIELENIDEFITTDEGVTINSMCAVFAESEIIGLLAAGTDRSLILRGVIRSIASKVGNMIGRAGCDDCNVFLMTGGLARSRKIVEEIEKSIGKKVMTVENSQFAGAIGAGVHGFGDLK
ncbi:MAG: acyl-CoA dehydratase activase [Anaerovorax sp.]